LKRLKRVNFNNVVSVFWNAAEEHIHIVVVGIGGTRNGQWTDGQLIVGLAFGESAVGATASFYPCFTSNER